MLEFKICSKCKTKKSSIEFYQRPERPCGLSPSCKECKRNFKNKRNKEIKAQNPILFWTKSVFSDAKYRAKIKNIIFHLKLNDIVIDENSKCVYCDTNFNFIRDVHTRNDSPTLDRIMPSKGYVKNNIVICCYRCNSIKNDASANELHNIANKIDLLVLERNLHGEN